MVVRAWVMKVKRAGSVRGVAGWIVHFELGDIELVGVVVVVVGLVR